MKTTNLFIAAGVACVMAFTSCNSNSTTAAENPEATEATTTETESDPGGGQASVSDDESQKDVVKVAVGSPDHTTLVAAVKAAGLVNSLSNAGPFTVFAPVNAAFDALPAGTVDNLLKPENKGKLEDILQYHVTVSSYDIDRLTDGMTLGQVNGGNVTITHKDGKVMVNDATILGSVKASNGTVHVIDKVLLPQ
ncbi:MAG: fasciclin domain-containing protein [Sphingobacteriales bacterium]|nr:MAG: fasciclin domain-containing protein [Sphingobacteriales bacterium]